MSSSEEELNDFEIFNITVNLHKQLEIYRDEITGYLNYVIEKYLIDVCNTQHIDREYVTNFLMYEKNFIGKIGEISPESDKLSTKTIIAKFWDLMMESTIDMNRYIKDMVHVQQGCIINIIKQKNKRRTLEDRTCFMHDLLLLINKKNLFDGQISYYGVFDGHAGDHAAQYLCVFSPCFLAQRIGLYFESSKEFSIKQLSQCLSNAIVELNVQYCLRYSGHGSGSTLNILVKINQFLIFLNIGDSRSCIVNNDGIVIDTTPLLHNLDVKSEREFCQSKGGKITESPGGIFRLMGQLSISRSFGDAKFQPYFNHTPDVIVHERTGTELFVIIGSDGFWEATQLETLSHFHQLDNSEIVEYMERLVHKAKSITSDNISLMTIKLQ